MTTWNNVCDPKSSCGAEHKETQRAFLGWNGLNTWWSRVKNKCMPTSTQNEWMNEIKVFLSQLFVLGGCSLHTRASQMYQQAGVWIFFYYWRISCVFFLLFVFVLFLWVSFCITRTQSKKEILEFDGSKKTNKLSACCCHRVKQLSSSGV